MCDCVASDSTRRNNTIQTVVLLVACACWMCQPTMLVYPLCEKCNPSRVVQRGRLFFSIHVRTTHTHTHTHARTSGSATMHKHISRIIMCFLASFFAGSKRQARPLGTVLKHCFSRAPALGQTTGVAAGMLPLCTSFGCTGVIAPHAYAKRSDSKRVEVAI